MGKKSLKQPALSERDDDAGCLSGLISIFDFRVGHYSQKLLSDRKDGNARRKLDFPGAFDRQLEDIDGTLHKDSDQSTAKGVNSAMVSIKELLEEEMSRTNYSKTQKHKFEQSQSESGVGIYPTGKYKKQNNNSSTVLDHHANNFIGYSNVDLAEFMVEFYCKSYHGKVQSYSEIDLSPLSKSDIHKKKIHFDEIDFHIFENHSTLQKALSDVAKVFLSQKLADPKQFAKNGAVQSREFIDAFEILNSNKELILNLIKDPNSLLLKLIQQIQDDLVATEILREETSSLEQHEESSNNEKLKKQSHHSFFRKKDKYKGSGSSDETSKISVLKPSPAIFQNDSATQTLSSSPRSQHSLRHRDEGEKTKSYFSLKGIKRKLRRVIGENKKGQYSISMDGVLDKMSYGFEDSRNDRESCVLSSKTSCDSERKEVSFPEYNLLSPRSSPRRDKELLLSPRKIMISSLQKFNHENTMNHLNQMRQNLDQNTETQVADSNRECFAEDLNSKESTEILEASDIKSFDEHDKLDAFPQSIDNGLGVICQGCQLGASNAEPKFTIQSRSVSPRFLHVEKLENPAGTLDNIERPSPVSVLDPFFSNDIASPESTTSEHADLPLQPHQIDFQVHDKSEVTPASSDFEDKPIFCLNEKGVLYSFITTLLEKRNPSNRLLNPSLFEEVCILHDLTTDDPKLLFDCIDEVLADTQKREFECSPWISLIKPTSKAKLSGEELVEEVCKGIDQIALKDIEGRSWMSLRFEIEEIVIEVADAILEKLIAETVSKRLVRDFYICLGN